MKKEFKKPCRCAYRIEVIVLGSKDKVCGNCQGPIAMWSGVDFDGEDIWFML